MKTRPRTDTSSTAYDARIDAALRVYGGAAPAPGLESRVAARISATPRQSYRAASSAPTGARWMVLLRGFSVGALATAAACAIVVGTVRHSQQLAIPQAMGSSRSGGVSAASGTHVPTRAIQQSPTIDPQAPRSAPHNRATVSGNAAKKGVGSVTPRSPYPPGQASTTPQQ
jgi:hypothetical protein